METEPDIARATSGAALSRAVSGRRAWWVRAQTLAFGVAVVAGLWLSVVPEESGDRRVQLALAALAIAGTMMSPRLPVIAAIVAGAATATAWLLGMTADPFVLTGVAVFAVAERRGSRRFPWWMVSGVLILLLASLGLSMEGNEDRFRALLLSALVLSVAWILGVRTRQAQVEAAARSRAEERLRLARDVHDVLSHSLGTIGVRAGVAAHVTSLGEADLRTLLREIEEGSRDSLAELKQLLQRERAPSPGADGYPSPTSLKLTAVLAGIAQSAESTGLHTRLDVSESVDRVSAAVRSTVHRVVQEAVTNVIRHASASSLVIAVRAFDDRVDVHIQDDGRGAPGGVSEGHGLSGMRERVALIGGALDIVASPRSFTVSATLPCSASPHGGES